MERVKKYFPIINWAPNYNGQWAIQECFAKKFIYNVYEIIEFFWEL